MWLISARCLLVTVTLSPEVWRESSILLEKSLSKQLATSVAKSTVSHPPCLYLNPSLEKGTWHRQQIAVLFRVYWFLKLLKCGIKYWIISVNSLWPWVMWFLLSKKSADKDLSDPLYILQCLRDCPISQIFLDRDFPAAWHASLLPPALSGELYMLLLGVPVPGRPKWTTHMMLASHREMLELFVKHSTNWLFVSQRCLQCVLMCRIPKWTFI